MTCNIVKNNNGVAFVCTRGNKKLTKDDERKIEEIIKNLSKKLEKDYGEEELNEIPKQE